jgi:hypothetical protein
MLLLKQFYMVLFSWDIPINFMLAQNDYLIIWSYSDSELPAPPSAPPSSSCSAYVRHSKQSVYKPVIAAFDETDDILKYLP